MKHSSVLPTILLHVQEMPEHVLSDEKMAKALARNTKKIFDDMLEDPTKIVKKSNGSPHFRDD